MRLWSIHPRYLDSQGLVAVWREALLAKKVLQGKTKSHKNHPQLIRFKNSSSPLKAIDSYLREIFKEARRRGYNFGGKKLGLANLKKAISVTNGQLKYEIGHLLRKLKARDKLKYKSLKNKKRIAVHPLFLKVKGKIEQ
jgi:hypothetical protein